MPIDLRPLLIHLPAWALVLFRLTGIFFFAPVLGSAAIPARVKVFLALGLSFCIYPMLLTPGQPSADHLQAVIRSDLSLWALPAAVAMELLLGLALGFAASLPILGMQLAGQIADQQMGIGLGGLINPEYQEDSGVLGQFYFLLALAVFVVLGGHRILLATLVGSFARVPLGGFEVDGNLVRLLFGLTASAFELALRVSAPLLCLVFLETVAMGFLARTVPQMNILSVGFALRILAGSAVLIAALNVKTGVLVESLQRNLRLLAGFFGSEV